MRARAPLDWANTRGNMGVALLTLAGRSEDCSLAREAVALLTEAAEVLREGEHVPRAETFERQLPDAHALVTRLCG